MMRFRYARHTSSLQKIKSFYIDLLGFELLGSFENHEGYDGIFIGLKEQDWELEFTSSEENPNHQADDDDLLVFYLNDKEELALKKTLLASKGLKMIPSKNPYWKKNGFEIKDPDGFGLVFALRL
ncbi:MAG: VOC family protein [Saprospiraceae bacterium]